MRAVQSARDVVVALAGAPLEQPARSALVELSVRQALSAPAQCELVFAGAATAVPAALRLAAPLRVVLAGFDTPLFDGEVTAVQQVATADRAREVRVRAYDRSHRLRKQQRVRMHVQVSAASLAAELAAGAGLSVRADADGPRWELLAQHRQTDLELLVEVLQRCGLHYLVEGDELRLFSADAGGETLALELGDTLLEATEELNAEVAASQVRAAAWNPLTAEAHGGAAQAGAGDEAVAAFGGDGRALPGLGAADDGHAEGLARADLDARAASETTLWGVADGDPRLRPGRRVRVAALPGGQPAEYVLASAVHTVDGRRGYLTTIDSRPPRPRFRPSGAVPTLGHVTRVDDPDSKGRVRATLPAYFDVETGWMEVLTMGAGPDKGLVVLPDVGDRVLVLLADGDPAAGLVLGGLYGPQAAPGAGGVHAGAVRSYALLTPGGQTVRLDDDLGGVHVADRSGSLLELGPQRVRLHAATDLEISAPGRRIVLRAAAIDMESA